MRARHRAVRGLLDRLAEEDAQRMDTGEQVRAQRRRRHTAGAHHGCDEGDQHLKELEVGLCEPLDEPDAYEMDEGVRRPCE